MSSNNFKKCLKFGAKTKKIDNKTSVHVRRIELIVPSDEKGEKKNTSNKRLWNFTVQESLNTPLHIET